jgi:lipoate-protein ligase B
MTPEFRLPRRSAGMPCLHVYPLGIVAHDDFEHLQRRLAYEAASRGDRRITLLLAEHPLHVTLGRAGSREEILLSAEMLTDHEVELEFVARGGGCLPHGPGQLVAGLVVPLERLQWTAGSYLSRLQAGLQATLQGVGVEPVTRPDRFGLWGQSGLLAPLAISVRHGVATFGAWLNVETPGPLCQYVLAAPGDPQPRMGSLLAERATKVRMEDVREQLPQHLAAAFGCADCQYFTHHPLLPAAENYVTRRIA